MKRMDTGYDTATLPTVLQKSWRVDSAIEEVYLELQDMFTRHPHKQFIWRGLWPTFLRSNLGDRLHVNTSGAH